MLFFFFKQKTAYEMRISDWSSDVCSSDLPDGRDPPCLDRPSGRSDTGQSHGSRQAPAISHRRRDDRRDLLQRDERGEPPVSGQPLLSPFELRRTRSEEHTSELQSLMRNSYAVFCLKKKTLKRQHKTSFMI